MGDVQQVLQLRNGMRLPVPEGETLDSVFAKHCAMSLTEGLCPHHQAVPEAVAATDGRLAIYCKGCSAYWSYEKAREAVSWDAGYDRNTGGPIIPAWLLV